MRVAIVLPPREGFSPGAVGAIGLVVRQLARAASATVIGASCADPFAGVDYRVATPGWRLGATARYATGVARVIAELSPDLIEVHNRPVVACSLAHHFSDRPVSLFLHNDPAGMRGARRPGQRRRLLGRLARVVTVSDWVRDQVLTHVEDAPRVPVTLPNPIDLSALPPPVALRQRVILFAGRVVADKGADLFVEACARVLPRLPGWRAEMIGGDRFSAASPDTPFLRALSPRAQAANIAMTGYRPHGVVLEAMARAAIVVVPSRWPEPFGLTALEALASGAALVCSGSGGLREVVGEAALLVEPEISALATALQGLACDPERRAALGRAGQARAARFDLPVVAGRLAALRQELLA